MLIILRDVKFSFFFVILRATIYKKGADPKINYFKYDFVFNFFLFEALLSRSLKENLRPNEVELTNPI
jgi:hypothetical protein